MVSRSAARSPAVRDATSFSSGHPVYESSPILKRPVLILGWIPRIIVPIARSLHSHGIQVDLADCVNAPRIAYRSRAIREFVRVQYPDYSLEEFATGLRDFIKRQGHDLLIPTDDLGLTALMECYEDLKDIVEIACPPPSVTRRVLNKAYTLEAAQRCGICVPRTVIVSNSEQLNEQIDGFPFPWVLKPVAKERRLKKFKSCSISSVHDITRLFPAPREFDPPMLLQEHCAGDGVGVEILLHRGECVAVFQHRRLKELPYTGGVSVTAVSEPPDPTLVQQSTTLLRALEWEGPAMVEFKVNSADGRVTLMEVNGRYWGTISLPITAGIDFPLYDWQLRHGEPVAACKSYSAGIKWRWTTGRLDRLYRLFAEARDSDSARKALRKDLLSLPMDFTPLTRDATFRFSDPFPSLIHLARALYYFAQHLPEAIKGELPEMVF